MVLLLCPVRGCGATLPHGPSQLVCPRGHAFDRARSGYVNLLQPQDSRSRHPGDSRAAVQARRRFADGGHDDWLLAELLLEHDAIARERGAIRAILDVGCGEGFLPGSLSRARGVDAHGIDISTPAVELAAKRYPGPTWIVGNADRFLPWENGSFDLVTSFTARRNGPEMRRVLAPAGVVLVAVPADDDLIELRRAILGSGERRDRAEAAIEGVAPDLQLVSRRTARRTALLDPPSLRDLLAATYRGARTSRHAAAEALAAMEVTLSRELLRFRAVAT